MNLCIADCFWIPEIGHRFQDAGDGILTGRIPEAESPAVEGDENNE